MNNKYIYLCDIKDCREDGDIIDLSNGGGRPLITRCRQHRPNSEEILNRLEASIDAFVSTLRD